VENMFDLVRETGAAPWRTAQEQVRDALEWSGDSCLAETKSGSYSGNQVLERVCAIRDELLRRGLQPQEFCAYAGTDDLAVMCAPLGIMLAGGAFLGLPNYHGVSEWVRFLRETGARFVLCEGYLVQRLQDAVAQVGLCVECIEVTPDGTLVAPSGSDSFDDYEPASVDEIVTVRFTTGASGLSQGVLFTHTTWCYDVLRIAFLFGCREAGRYLQLTPNTDVQGIAMCLAALVRREAVVVYQGKPSNEGIVCSIERDRITDLFLPSSQMIKLALSDASAMADLSSLKRFVYGGQKAAAADIRLAHEYLDCELVQMYGSTEAGILTWLSPEDHEREDDAVFDSAGRPIPIPGVQIEIRDPRTREVLPTGQVGHVTTCGCGVNDRSLGVDTPAEMMGSWRDTLDKGYFDEDGYLHICGVDRDVIMYRGFVMYASEIEDALTACSGVREAVAHAVSNDKDGEHVVVWCTSEEDACVDSAALSDALAVECGPWYRPEEIRIVRQIPCKREDGAYDKQALRTLVESGDFAMA